MGEGSQGPSSGPTAVGKKDKVGSGAFGKDVTGRDFGKAGDGGVSGPTVKGGAGAKKSHQGQLGKDLSGGAFAHEAEMNTPSTAHNPMAKETNRPAAPPSAAHNPMAKETNRPTTAGVSLSTEEDTPTQHSGIRNQAPLVGAGLPVSPAQRAKSFGDLFSEAQTSIGGVTSDTEATDLSAKEGMNIAAGVFSGGATTLAGGFLSGMNALGTKYGTLDEDRKVQTRDYSNVDRGGADADLNAQQIRQDQQVADEKAAQRTAAAAAKTKEAQAVKDREERLKQRRASSTVFATGQQSAAQTLFGS